MKSYISIISLVTMAMFVTSCVQQDFDEPMSKPVSELEPTHTIAEIKKMHRAKQVIPIQDSIIIRGKVISDDEQGNFYKSMVIQDETGGIELRINQNQLQAVYQRNRVVLVKCKGLNIGDYGGFIQLGYGTDNDGALGRIPETLMREFIECGDYSTTEDKVVPKEVLISNITSDMYGTLVKLNQVEFSRDDFEKTYADAVNEETLNRIVEDCLGGQVTLRTSGFCDFAGALTPFGNGSIVGVLTVFNSTLQMMIRDTNDVDMPNAPCNRSSEPASLISIKDVRNLYHAGTTLAPDAKYIQGVVTSDYIEGNLHELNMIIQDETAGILVRFTSNHSFTRNDEVRIDISGLSLGEYQGMLQISGTSLDRANIIGTSNPVEPVDMTIEDLLADFENLEGSLIKISNAQIDGSTYSGAREVTDGTGTIVMYTRSSASFASNPIPSGDVNITAIVSQGGNSEEMQIIIRDENDVEGGTSGPGGADTLRSAEFFDFEDQTAFENIVIKGWQNIAIKGTRYWWGQEFSGNHYAQATAYNSGLSEMEVWLVTQPIDLSTISTMQLETANFAWVHDGLKIYISTDYAGGDVGNAQWADLGVKVAGENDGDHTWVPSGEVDLSAYSGIGYIAFVHVGNTNNQTTSYRLDNIQFE